MKLLNEAEIYDTWSGMLKEQTGIQDEEKLKWMSKYCHYHSLNEAFTYPSASLLNTPGMGNVMPAGDAAGGASAFYGNSTTGSGDKFPSLLPLAIQVAARTVGFDIVSVIPMSGPTGVLTYLDYVYAGGKQPFGAPPGGPGNANPGINSYTDLPLVFKIRVDNINSLDVSKEYVIAKENVGSGDKGIHVIYVGKSRIDGSAIFRTIGTVEFDNNQFSSIDNIPLGDIIDGNISNNVYKVINPGEIDTSSVTEVGTNTAELVKTLEDHIQGFSGAGAEDDMPWSGDAMDRTVIYEPMRRGVGEEQYYRTIGLQAFTKFVEVETYQIAATVTTEQIQDLNRQYGIDVISMLENALVNDISQSINKHILSRAFALGWTNNNQFRELTGINLNLNLVPGAGSSITNDWAVGMYGTLEDLVMPAYQNYGSFENQNTLHRRIYSKILAAANVIAQRGRRGPANFIVTNLQIATALQDSAQFTFAPMANTISQNNGTLYPLGTIAGMTVYVDPNMSYGDNRILVGRKGTDEEPGLKFMPYLMAESIQTIAEGTMSPKIAVKSRYALVEAGHHPQTQYFTIAVDVPAGGIV